MPKEISITELNGRLERLENLVSELLELAKLSNDALRIINKRFNN